ncbi:MAG: hypoxanthine phosphoribosyltransferase [Candidatus Marinimicrobia bacterium]|nr:hypoxanthine phosphoribosyltransferase [Candidatus Neomarinimicrobiota bacterium]
MNFSKKLKLKFSADHINNRVKKIGRQLSIHYKNKNPIFVGILNGSFIFMSDLIREISVECEICFIQLKSYDGKRSTGTVEVLKDLDINLNNRHIVIVEDIIDSGTTLKFLLNTFEQKSVKSLSIVSLLVKKTNKPFNFKIDHIGFEISQEFVVGYGLDFNNKFRHLDSIYILE